MRKLILFIILFIISCGIKQPVDTSDDVATGSIFVQSGLISGQIFLDGQNTDKFTPDTLFKILPDSHVVKVIKEGYKSIPDSIKIFVEANKVSSAIVELEKLVQIGFVLLETTPANGEIFVDEQTTGQFTPDTIQIEAGLHQIEVKKNGYMPHILEINVVEDSLLNFEATLEINQRVLFESFANVSCDPCVEAAENLEQFVNTANPEQYAIIEYFAYWPSPNDPFYKVSPADIDKRLDYYQVMALPTLIIAGANSVDATDFPEILTTYDNELAVQKSSVGISIEKIFDYVNGDLLVNIEIYNFKGSLNNNQLRLFVAVIENDIHFDSPPGSNGLTDFEFVFRKFLTSNEGETIVNNSNSKKFEYVLKWQDWDYANSKVIAFIQHKSSKQIIQTSIK